VSAKRKQVPEVSTKRKQVPPVEITCLHFVLTSKVVRLRPLALHWALR
jgi:hypothetical protein